MLKYNLIYNIVGNSPWAILLPFNILSIMFTYIIWIHQVISNTNLLIIIIIQLLSLIAISLYWVSDISDEIYHHNTILNNNLRLGFNLFVISEILLFITFFLSYGYYIFIMDYIIYDVTPIGINRLQALGIPLLNTAILYVSGITVTLSSYNLIINKWYKSIGFLVIAIILGSIFTFFQLYEYMNAEFTISDGYYGSIFYLTTGFHGIHVVIGTIFLLYSIIKIINKSWHSDNTTMYNNSILYWHFVDYVWLFLFTALYLV